MSRRIDISNQRFGMLTAISRCGRKHRISLWLCRCDCGVEKPVYFSLLRNGEARSCGCARTPKAPLISRIKDGSVVDEVTGCWNWPGGKNASGYGRTSEANGSRDTKTTISTHRMSWIAFNGEIPAGLYVLHRCDNRACCNPDHLFLGTHQDNMDDMMKKGRHSSQKKRAAIDAAKKGGV